MRPHSCERASRTAVGCSDLPGWTIHHYVPLIQPDHAVTLCHQEVYIVRYEHCGDAGLHQPLHTDNALPHEKLIAYPKDLIHQQHFWLNIRRQGKGEAPKHTGRVVFDWLIDKLLEFRKTNDTIHLAVDFGCRIPHQGASQKAIFTSGKLRVKPKT